MHTQVADLTPAVKSSFVLYAYMYPFCIVCRPQVPVDVY